MSSSRALCVLAAAAIAFAVPAGAAHAGSAGNASGGGSQHTTQASQQGDQISQDQCKDHWEWRRDCRNG